MLLGADLFSEMSSSKKTCDIILFVILVKYLVFSQAASKYYSVKPLKRPSQQKLFAFLVCWNV